MNFLDIIMSSRSTLLLLLYLLFSCCPKPPTTRTAGKIWIKSSRTTTWNSWSRSGTRSNKTAQIKIFSVVNLKNLVFHETRRIWIPKQRSPVTTACETMRLTAESPKQIILLDRKPLDLGALIWLTMAYFNLYHRITVPTCMFYYW